MIALAKPTLDFKGGEKVIFLSHREENFNDDFISGIMYLDLVGEILKKKKIGERHILLYFGKI